MLLRAGAKKGTVSQFCWVDKWNDWIEWTVLALSKVLLGLGLNIGTAKNENHYINIILIEVCNPEKTGEWKFQLKKGQCLDFDNYINGIHVGIIKCHWGWDSVSGHTKVLKWQFQMKSAIQVKLVQLEVGAKKTVSRFW